MTGGPARRFGGFHGLEAIKEADELARRLGVDGALHFFIVNGRLTLSGAQQSDAFLKTFRQAAGLT
jgi:predicted DsbA family dithiol-disulfide isomerase